MRKFPRDVSSRNILAELLEQAGRRDEAERLLGETMRKFPRDVYSRNILARLLEQAGRRDEAERLLRETMRKFPRDVSSRNILAELLEQAGRRDEAERLLRETMRKFPYDIYGRNNLVEMLRRQGRHDEADAESLAPSALVSDHRDIQSLGKMMTTTQTEEGKGVWFGFPEDRGRENNAGMRKGVEPGQAAEPEDRRDGIGVDAKIISEYLERLKKQVPLFELYFAPLTQMNGTGTSLGELDLGASELELVAAHRIGQMEQPAKRELLGTWANAHPSSYSARLLLAWQGQEGNGLDHAAMSKIAEEFPEHRHWNNWLRYGFISKEERDRIRQEELDTIRQEELDTIRWEATDREDGTITAFWGGRSSAVYPGLKMGDEDNENAVRHVPAAMKRLLEDVAFAGAERALPSVSIS